LPAIPILLLAQEDFATWLQSGATKAIVRPFGGGGGLEISVEIQ